MTSEDTGETEAGVELASKSDVGRVRSANEDSCDTFERADGTRLLVVADGMGGHQGGATASQTALETIADRFQSDTPNSSEELLRDAIEAANARVYEMAQADQHLTGMGTTVVAFMLDANRRGTVAHVGDSRAYRYRQGLLEPLTVDHSVVAEMHRRGLISAEEAAVHPRRNEILRSVGVLPNVDVEVASVDALAGDRFLLCSDGLTGVVSDEEIAAVVQVESPGSAVETLVRMANERGGPDNITVQVMSIPTSASEADPEATAPVELSEVGIRAIEGKRRERQRLRRLVGVAAITTFALGGYFVWRLFQVPAPSPQPSATTSSLGDRNATSSPVFRSAPSTPLNPLTVAPLEQDAGHTENSKNRLDVENAPPRRGIPR